MPLKKFLSRRRTQERQLRRQPHTAAIFHKVLSRLWSHGTQPGKEGNPRSGLAHVARHSDHVEPRTYEEALAFPEAAEWKLAMNEELASLHAHDTWTLEKQPAGVKPIPVKWVFKIKRKAAGHIERYKTRLVAKGFMQRERIDCTEVFAPVSKHTTLRTLLA